MYEGYAPNILDLHKTCIASACWQAQVLAKVNLIQRSVLVGGKEVDVAVSIGTIVFIGSEVADGIDVFVGVEGWKGVAVAVEFGLTVTRLKSGAHEASVQLEQARRRQEFKTKRT